MLIKVVTDSTADLPHEVVRGLGIEVVPVYILWEGKSYRDGVDLQPEEFFSRLVASNVMPTTSQPTQADFMGIYDRLEKESDGIVSIHVSAKLSGTYEASLQASRSHDKRVPVEVIDSQLNSMGLGLVAIAAARMAAAGGGLKEVVHEARQTMTQVRMLGIFDTLKYAIAGGRIDRSLGKIASILNIKPVLTFRHGEVSLAGAVRNYEKGVIRLAEFVRKNLPLKELAVVHSAAPEAANSLITMLGTSLADVEVYVNQLGASLGVHGGPGILLVALRPAISRAHLA